MITEQDILEVVKILKRWKSRAQAYKKKQAEGEVDKVLRVIEDLYGRKIDV